MFAIRLLLLAMGLVVAVPALAQSACDTIEAIPSKADLTQILRVAEAQFPARTVRTIYRVNIQGKEEAEGIFPYASDPPINIIKSETAPLTIVVPHRFERLLCRLIRFYRLVQEGQVGDIAAVRARVANCLPRNVPARCLEEVTDGVNRDYERRAPDTEATASALRGSSRWALVFFIAHELTHVTLNANPAERRNLPRGMGEETFADLTAVLNLAANGFDIFGAVASLDAASLIDENIEWADVPYAKYACRATALAAVGREVFPLAWEIIGAWNKPGGPAASSRLTPYPFIATGELSGRPCPAAESVGISDVRDDLQRIKLSLDANGGGYNPGSISASGGFQLEQFYRSFSAIPTTTSLGAQMKANTIYWIVFRAALESFLAGESSAGAARTFYNSHKFPDTLATMSIDQYWRYLLADALLAFSLGRDPKGLDGILAKMSEKLDSIDQFYPPALRPASSGGEFDLPNYLRVTVAIAAGRCADARKLAAKVSPQSPLRTLDPQKILSIVEDEAECRTWVAPTRTRFAREMGYSN